MLQTDAQPPILISPLTSDPMVFSSYRLAPFPDKSGSCYELLPPCTPVADKPIFEMPPRECFGVKNVMMCFPWPSQLCPLC